MYFPIKGSNAHSWAIYGHSIRWNNLYNFPVSNISSKNSWSVHKTQEEKVSPYILIRINGTVRSPLLSYSDESIGFILENTIIFTVLLHHYSQFLFFFTIDWTKTTRLVFVHRPKPTGCKSLKISVSKHTRRVSDLQPVYSFLSEGFVKQLHKILEMSQPFISIHSVLSRTTWLLLHSKATVFWYTFRTFIIFDVY